MAQEYKAYLRVRSFDTRDIISSVGLTNLRHSHVEKVMMGMLRNMNTDDYFIDDSEVDVAREVL